MNDKNSLIIVWSSGDRDVALNMVFMYALNSKLNEWWDDVQLIIWGPSSKLLSTDEEVQEHLDEMREAGVVLKACKACADRYGVSKELNMGVNVKYMEFPLTEYIKQNRNIITF